VNSREQDVKVAVPLTAALDATSPAAALPSATNVEARLKLLPRMLARGDDGAGSLSALASLRRNVIAEIGLGATILAIVGALGTASPPIHRHEPMDHHAVTNSQH
jgi:hypothetical protein